MSSSSSHRCLFSPARALRRVFVLPNTGAAASSSSSPRHALLLPLRAGGTAVRIPPQSPSPQQARALTTTPCLSRLASSKSGGGKNNNGGKGASKKNRRNLINSAIPYKWVRISDRAAGTLSEPRRTADVLAELDRRTHTLEMVAPPPPASSEGGGGESGSASSSSSSSSDRVSMLRSQAAICRIVDRVAQEAAFAEAQREARRREVGRKELELNWAISPHDLSHKLRRLREFLAKGFSVDVMMARKRGGRAAGQAEAQAVLDQVREAAEGVPGVMERKKMDGGVGGVARLFYQGAPAGKKNSKEKGKGKDGSEGEEEGEGDE
ncbi:hypothetical protein F4778DRAFT_713557 [Xylariomycetidae sp. FL2044]|nr:hypothetical protein F4778DRAFT_713557 [Xylariomycetidae sp. FL2044]